MRLEGGIEGHREAGKGGAFDDAMRGLNNQAINVQSYFLITYIPHHNIHSM